MDKLILEDIKKESCNIAVLVKDLKKDKLLFNYNEDVVFPSASIIKVIIIMAVLKKVEQGEIALEDRIYIDEKAFVEYSTISEEKAESYTLDELIKWAIITSDNTATNILIDGVGFEYVNQLALTLGLSSTSLNRKMMDFEAIKNNKNNYTSVLDMLKVMELIYNNRFISEEVCNYILKVLKMQRDKAMLMRFIAEDIKIAHKTGELDNLDHDMGIVYLEDTDYFIGIFVEGCESNDYGQKLIGRLSKKIYGWMKREYRGIEGWIKE